MAVSDYFHIKRIGLLVAIIIVIVIVLLCINFIPEINFSKEKDEDKNIKFAINFIGAFVLLSPVLTLGGDIINGLGKIYKVKSTKLD